jgi:hypothetical protein
MRGSRSGLALFLGLLAVYAATLALPGRGGGERSDREERILVVATTLQEEGRVALEPVDLGLPVLAVPLLELDGVAAVSLLCAAAMALALALAAALARRVVPDPWATGAALVVGLSPPVLGAASAIGPEPLAAALLAGAALCALRVREGDPHPQVRFAVVAAVLLAVLPWLSVELSLAGAVIAAALVRWMMRAGRGLQAILAGEAVVFSAVTYVSVHERLFGGIVPQVAGDGPLTGASGVAEHVERVTRLATLWVDRSAGLLAWAPFLVLVPFALWLLWRSRRERLAVALPALRIAEVTVTLCALACGAQLVVATFLARSLEGAWFPGLHLLGVLPLTVPLCAWGLRRAPRIGTALAGVTLLVSAWLVVAVAAGDERLAPPSPPAWLGVACLAAAGAGLAGLAVTARRG